MGKNQSFLNMFPGKIQEELIKFCARLTASTADTFVVMARKAVCLFQVMVQQGYIPHEIMKKTIVCDRVFDLTGGHGDFGKVAIIDDVVISGSTIAKTINKIKRSGVRDEDIEIIVLAVNRDTFNPLFFQMKDSERRLLEPETYAEISAGECLQLCTNISRSLSLIGHPYDIDYPHYANMHVIKSIALDTMIDPVMWKTSDNTNANHSKGGIYSYTVLPTKICRQSFDKYLGIELSSKLHFKLRMLVRENGDEYSFKTVPMILFRECSTAEINALFDAMFIETSKDEKSWFIEPRAKMRVLQFVFANTLMQFFCNSIGMAVPEIDKAGVDLIFGSERTPLIYRILHQKLPAIDVIFSELAPDLMGYKNENAPYSDTAEDEYNVNVELNEPFFRWYKEQEINDREALKSLFYYEVTDDKQYSRLDEGFSINALTNWIARYSDKYQLENLVSSYIDRAVDYGTIVPIIYQKEDGHGNIVHICRAFRHGEDYEFSEDDRNKLQYFYTQFFEDVRDNYVTQLEFYKFVALFLQMGEKVGLVDKFYGFKNDSQLLTVQYCIHGAVPVVFDPRTPDDAIHTYVQQNDYADWLTKREFKDDNLVLFKTDSKAKHVQMSEKLKEKVKKSKKKKEKRQENTEFSTVDPTAMAQIDEISMLLTALYNHFTDKRQKSLMQQYLVALTACMNSESFVSAIMAEIRIGILDWQGTVSPTIQTGDKRKIALFAENLRVNKMPGIESSETAFTAINSGRKKSKWFFGVVGEKDDPEGVNTVPDIIDFFSDTFEEIGRSYKVAWRKYWAQYESLEGSYTKQLDDIKSCVGDVYLLNVVYRLFQFIVLRDSLEGQTGANLETQQERVSHIYSEVRELIEEYSLYKFEEDPFKQIREATPESLQYSDINELAFMMDHRCQEMKDRIVHIERYLSNTQNKFTRRYSSVMIIDTPLGMDVNAFCVGLELLISENSKRLNGLGYRLIPLEDSGRAYDRSLLVFHADDPKRVSMILWQLIVNVTEGIEASSRCVVIPSLLDGYDYLYNVLGVAQGGIDNFHNMTVKHIEKAIDLRYYFEGLIILSRRGARETEITDELVQEIRKKKPAYKKYGHEKSDVPLEDASRGYTPTMFCKPTMKLGIITVLDCETKAVMDVLGLSKSFDPTGRQPRRYYEGVIESGKCNTKIFCTQQLDTGGSGAMDAFNALKNTFDPDYYILCGVAGSVDTKKAGIGDVVIASAVLDGTKASEDEDGIKHESYTEKMHPRITAILNDYFVDTRGTKYTSCAGAPNPEFTCINAPIADNGHVIKSDRAEFRRHAKQVNRKVVAVETEGAGFLFAYRSEGLSRESSKGAIIVRGISDAADIDKPQHDDWHDCASVHAAQIVSNLMPTIEDFFLQT